MCVAGGCRGPLFVLGPFVLAGDGLRGGALFGCFSRGFFICGKDHGCSLLFWPRRFEGENVLFLDNGQAAHCLWCVVVVCLFLSGFWAFHCFFDSSDLKGF